MKLCNFLKRSFKVEGQPGNLHQFSWQQKSFQTLHQKRKSIDIRHVSLALRKAQTLRLEASLAPKASAACGHDYGHMTSNECFSVSILTGDNRICFAAELNTVLQAENYSDEVCWLWWVDISYVWRVACSKSLRRSRKCILVVLPECFIAKRKRERENWRLFWTLVSSLADVQKFTGLYLSLFRISKLEYPSLKRTMLCRLIPAPVPRIGWTAPTES